VNKGFNNKLKVERNVWNWMMERKSTIFTEIEGGVSYGVAAVECNKQRNPNSLSLPFNRDPRWVMSGSGANPIDSAVGLIGY